MQRFARLATLALALLLTLPITALAEKRESKHEHIHVHDGEYEYEYEYEDEHDYEHEDEHGDEHEEEHGEVQRPLPAAGAPLVGVGQDLAASVGAVAADPANSRAAEAMRSLVRTAGPGLSRLWVSGRPVEAALVVQGDQVFLPLRATAAALGAQLFVDSATGAITVSRVARQIRLTPGKATAIVNGSPVALDAAPLLSGGSAYVSLMTLAEALVLQVVYDPESGMAVISELAPAQP